MKMKPNENTNTEKIVFENEKGFIIETSPGSGYFKYKNPDDVYADPHRPFLDQINAAFKRLDEAIAAREKAANSSTPTPLTP
jgi:hypothetical protein